MPGLADLMKDVSQGVLLVGLESNIKIDRGFVVGGSYADPVVWDDVPLVFFDHIVPRGREEGHRGTTEEGGSEDREHRGSEVAHNCEKASRGERYSRTRLSNRAFMCHSAPESW